MNMTPYQSDILKELINIGIGKAAGLLNELIEAHVLLKAPEIRTISIDMLEKEMENISSTTLSMVTLAFEGFFSGSASLIFPLDSASNLVSILTGEAIGSQDLNSVKSVTLTEVGNIVLNGVMGSLGNILNHNLNYSIPDYEEKLLKKMNIFNQINNDSVVILIKTQFYISDFRIEGDIILIFRVNSFDSLLKIINDHFEIKDENQ